MSMDITGSRTVPLRRNWRFQALWIGSTTGFLGMEAADVGYPLVILAITGSPAHASLFGFVQLSALIMLGLPAGRIIDRRDRRRVLLLVEGVRFLAVTSAAVALAMQELTLAHLLIVAAILGGGGALSGPARMLIVREIVPPEQLTAALTQEEVRDNLATLLGAPLGGFLFGVRQFLPFALSAVTFAVSWIAVLIVRVPAKGAAEESAPSGWLDGVRMLFRDPVLRAATLVVAALNTVGAPLMLITIVVLRDQQIPPWQTGLALSGLAVGGLLGAPLVRPLHGLRPGIVLLGVLLSQVPVFALLAVPLGPWWVFALLLWAMLGLPALGVLIDVLIFRQVPDDRRGSVIAATTTIAGIGAPVGSAAAGLLLQFLAPSIALLLVAVVLALAGAYLASNPGLRQARWPEQR
ncbi:MFS transporter [Nonomuraea sp. NPDC003804]|uniref:MFS transporter n=1 Tax=Nonomuraea sp. NPDC003804 TaxID=3154547 RepID=UPI0033A356C7